MVWQKIFVLFFGCLCFFAHGQEIVKEPIKPTSLYNFKCVTDFPSTSFLFTDDGDYFNVRIIHHNGTLYAPFFQRLLVPNEMAEIIEAAEVAKNTGDDLEFRWDKKACKWFNKEIFSCVGGGKALTTAKKEIKPWNISRTLVTTQTAGGEFKKYTLSLNYDIQGKSFEYLMDYQLHECEYTTD